MKKLKIFIIILLTIIGLIIIDTIQARIFKNSPLISWKDTQADSDSYVDRGILMDTYYCTYEQDIVTVHWQFKTSKFSCPIDNVEYEKLNDFELDMYVNDFTDSEEKVLIFERDNQKYYYINEKYSLYINSFDDTFDKEIYTKYPFKEAIEKEMLTFDEILSKAKNYNIYKDGGSKMYYYHDFNILVCNTINGNNDIIIGGKDIKAELCK